MGSQVCTNQVCCAADLLRSCCDAEFPRGAVYSCGAVRPNSIPNRCHEELTGRIRPLLARVKCAQIKYAALQIYCAAAVMQSFRGGQSTVVVLFDRIRYLTVATMS